MAKMSNTIGIIGVIKLVQEIAGFEHAADLRTNALSIHRRAQDLVVGTLSADLQFIQHDLRVAAERYSGNAYDLKQLEHPQAKQLIETFERQADNTRELADAFNEL